LNIRRRDAFTLIELMVSLVVAGLLMSALVALSGTVQRSFGRSKDIIELQANLRFAMNRMVDDVTRAAYMHSPNPQHAVDGRTLGVIPPSADVAIEYDGPNTPLTLRGNYASSRDYLLDLDDGKIVCRNQAPYNLTTKMCETSLGSYDPYHEPFSDGPGFADVFCPSELIRLDDGEGHYYYHEVGVATPGDYSLTLQNPSVNRAQLPGRYQWISPITEVIYRLDHDNTYTSPYGAGDPKDRCGSPTIAAEPFPRRSPSSCSRPPRRCRGSRSSNTRTRASERAWASARCRTTPASRTTSKTSPPPIP
jgi:prepilin-type N-terminal cleavage/methylation domain-containing protein